MTSVIADERIHVVRDIEPLDGEYVLYWMQAAVRTRHNEALEYAVQTANDLAVPLLVCFGVTADYPEASRRHFRFLVEGLRDVAPALERRQIGFVVRQGSPPAVAADLAGQASAVVTDRGYLRHLRAWRAEFAEAFGGPIHEVETNLVVPVETASDKREYAARTIRPKIHRHLGDFLVDLDTNAVDIPWTERLDGLDASDVDGVLDALDVDHAVPSVEQHFEGGELAAWRELRRFLDQRFDVYDEHRNQPQTDDVSYLSMYLHYGQISPVAAARAAKEAKRHGPNIDSFIEELVVRRELSHNYSWFEPDYDSYSALPEWSRKTLAKHRDDEREHLYTRNELEHSKTHDEYWNAAMTEMRETGYMHNYMRMYWGKKIIEWTNTPEFAYRTALYLNNKYLLDGRDPNSYTGVGWVFGLHDRPWTEREIFGTVRYMSAGGLERKADPEAYVEKVRRLVGETLF